MIRIVTAFMPDNSKHLLVMCDNPTCGQYISNPLELQDEKGSIEATIKVFQQVMGWSIGVFGHICPGHVEEQRNRVGQGERKLVTLVSSVGSRPI